MIPKPVAFVTVSRGPSVCLGHSPGTTSPRLEFERAFLPRDSPIPEKPWSPARHAHAQSAPNLRTQNSTARQKPFSFHINRTRVQRQGRPCRQSLFISTTLPKEPSVRSYFHDVNLPSGRVSDRVGRPYEALSPTTSVVPRFGGRGRLDATIFRFSLPILFLVERVRWALKLGTHHGEHKTVTYANTHTMSNL